MCDCSEDVPDDDDCSGGAGGAGGPKAQPNIRTDSVTGPRPENLTTGLNFT